MFLMAPHFRLKSLPRAIDRRLSWVKTLGILSVGMGCGLLFCINPAFAVETVELQYQDRSITVTLDDIRAFSETGEATTDLDTFIEGSEEVAELVGRLLTEEITLSPAFQERIQRDIRQSSLGQFLLTQINQFIQGSTELTALENAIQASLAENNRISILEIAENYEADVDRVTINLTEAGVVYRDVRGFVERVLPAVEVAREFLQDAICDCPTVTEVSNPSDPADDSDADTPQSILPGSLPASTVSQIQCQPSLALDAAPEPATAQLSN
ncbi:hypothetical protein C7B76_29645 [filamentous cyanobacterium CCP2]|nr:hypothetical protein C7B76_29645 [filamentous cyanobacterium CCP2]